MKFILTQSLVVSALMAIVLFAAYLIHVHFAANLKETLPLFYIVNLGLASATASSIFLCIEFKNEIAGFTFMGGSLVKFAVFFTLFSPRLSDEPTLRKAQITAFYIPYAICLVIEVWFLIRQMNRARG